LIKAPLPIVTYLVPSPRGHVPLDDSTSQAPMRLTRRGDSPPDDPIFNYGQYFKGIADVVSIDGYASLMKATNRQLGRDISLSGVDQILIYAEKHGSDYHPAKIEVVLPDAIATFVMNVAVTARGKARLPSEFEALQDLNRKHDFPYIPRTYIQGEAFLPPMLMFLADWFDGYHEFHLSVDPESGLQRMALWDSSRGHFYLSESQAWDVYRQAAMILTLYYDVETFEQIFPWHHAAGDFVVKPGGESVDVRLITARQYAPMLDRSGGVSVQDALLFFAANLSLRMRLDRLDGVGDVAWADDKCIRATLEGFMEGLSIKEQQGLIPKGFSREFFQDIRSFSRQGLSGRFHALIDACDQASPDIPVMRSHVERHISTVHATLQDLSVV